MHWTVIVGAVALVTGGVAGWAQTGRLSLDLSGLRNRPAWEARPVVPNPVSDNGKRYHIVAPGETGIAIARAYRVRWAEIIAANSLSEPFALRTGQRLQLPPAPSSAEARAAAFRIGIDDIVTGGQPAPRTASRASVPLPGPVRFAWPARGTVVARFGRQAFGRRNQGIDIDAPNGSSVIATAAGTVAYVGDDVPGYGGLILVRHNDAFISAYGRVARAQVAPGARVAGGQVIGRSGDDPVHFELRRARVPIDPLPLLPGR